MGIEHLAIWTTDLELMKAFYMKYFDMACNNKYVNHQKQFASYFLSFKDSNTRIELMQRPNILKYPGEKGIMNGLTHFAVSVGNKESVDDLTEKLRSDGFTIHGEPRITGDGYYESVILDPEGNLIEITL